MMRRRGGLVRGVARTAVVAGTATAVSGRVRRRQDDKWAEQEQAQYEQQRPSSRRRHRRRAAAASDDMAELQQAG